MEKEKEEKQKVVVNSVVNIYGGNTQVQPSVTEANQIITIIGGTEQTSATQQAQAATDIHKTTEDITTPSTPEAVISLRKYVNSDERIKLYMEEIERCSTASELAMTVVRMCANEDWLTPDEVKKERFISIMRDLAKNLTKGDTINNIRARIDAELKSKDMR